MGSSHKHFGSKLDKKGDSNSSDSEKSAKGSGEHSGESSDRIVLSQDSGFTEPMSSSLPTSSSINTQSNTHSELDVVESSADSNISVPSSSKYANSRGCNSTLYSNDVHSIRENNSAQSIDSVSHLPHFSSAILKASQEQRLAEWLDCQFRTTAEHCIINGHQPSSNVSNAIISHVEPAKDISSDANPIAKKVPDKILPHNLQTLPYQASATIDCAPKQELDQMSDISTIYDSSNLNSSASYRADDDLSEHKQNQKSQLEQQSDSVVFDSSFVSPTSAPEARRGYDNNKCNNESDKTLLARQVAGTLNAIHNKHHIRKKQFFYKIRISMLVLSVTASMAAGMLLIMLMAVATIVCVAIAITAVAMYLGSCIVYRYGHEKSKKNNITSDQIIVAMDDIIAGRDSSASRLYVNANLTECINDKFHNNSCSNIDHYYCAALVIIYSYIIGDRERDDLRVECKQAIDDIINEHDYAALNKFGISVSDTRLDDAGITQIASMQLALQT